MTDVIRVLLIEDDEDDYFLTADYLSQCQEPRFDITWVTNSAEAVAAFRCKLFDICLLDYILGAENAIDVLNIIKSKGISIPVVILTGQSDAKVDEMVMRAGAADYLTKSEIETPRFMRTMRYAMVRREIENERIERHKVEQQNKAKDKFLAHLGHELRTPLTSILGYTELLLDDAGNERMQQELSIIHTNGKHLLSLLNDLLDMSRIMANKLELSPKDINLSGFMTDVHSLMNLAAKDKGLRLSINCQSPLPESIKADPTRLRQVLINLISNAVKFTDSGNIEVSLEVFTSHNSGEERLRFSVKDSGIGMPPDKLDDIFHPFEQIEDVMRANHGGAGLGLAICRELVHKMGGDISVESNFGKGSVFSFYINPGDISEQPRDELNLAAPSSRTPGAMNLHVSGRVLIVDDLRELRRLTGHMVSQCHAQVAYAENGVKALEAVLMAEQEGKPFHLVLMDIHMPVMNGIDSLKAMRKHNCKTAVVAITAASRKGLKQSLMDEGFDDILGKPIEKNALMQILDKYLIRTPDPALADVSLPDGANASPDTSISHNDNASNKTENTQPEESPGSDTKRVLVIEDDHDAADLMQLLISHQGHQVAIANTGEQAISHVDQEEYDFILLDLTLPDYHGFELADALQKHINDTTTIVVVSGREPDASDLTLHNISHSLLKPVSKDDLSTLLA
ncbi:response regulator [Salinimonas sp. HHU 13199]|uniref:histidine kinase n=1 Tax=Salinimonas profundi TaxID=2729140 RepID=A0ABR8LD14_9ALTE|nr:response regulator [Salinimonas profundi]MBD3584206.1 response regulator [Salinimonas profundi]